MTQSHQRIGARANWKAFFVTVLTFVALGPPIGALIILLLREWLPGFADFPFIIPPGIGLSNPVSILLGLVYFGLSYFAGGLQALVTGVAVAAHGMWWGKIPLVVPVAAAALVFAASYVLLWSELPRTVPTMLVVHLVPAALCWFITRRLWQVAT